MADFRHRWQAGRKIGRSIRLMKFLEVGILLQKQPELTANWILVISSPFSPPCYQILSFLFQQASVLVISGPFSPPYHQNLSFLFKQAPFLVISGLIPPPYHKILSFLSSQTSFLVISGLSSPPYHQIPGIYPQQAKRAAAIPAAALTAHP